MTAILLFSGRSFGGVERRFARLAQHLITAGRPVTVICTADAAIVMRELGIDIPEERLMRIDRPSTGCRLRDKMNRLAGLVRLLLRLKTRRPSDHVHLALNPGLVASLFGLMGLRYSLSAVDTYFNSNPVLFRISVARAAAIDCLSETIAAGVRRRLRTGCKTPIHVSPCSFTDYTCVQRASKRDIDVAFISRPVAHKGHDLLQDALGRLPPLIVSDGPTNDPFGLLARSKIFLSLQDHENYPSQALLEAMASGCAIIATDVGETRRLVDESCGALIPRDGVALAQAIERLLADQPTLFRMGEAARTRAVARHTVERFACYFWSMVQNPS